MNSEQGEVAAKKYLRAVDVEAIYSIKAGVLYNLINSNRIRSIRLSEGSVKKATRLIDHESLIQYLAGLQANQSQTESGE